MTIKIADRLPSGQIQEYVEIESPAARLARTASTSTSWSRARLSSCSGVPGAFTPTCSAQHVPGFLRHYDEFRSKGVDETVLRRQRRIRDGGVGARSENRRQDPDDGRRSGDYTTKLGLEYDLRAGGLGVRCQRFSMLVQDGVGQEAQHRGPGKFEVSSAEACCVSSPGKSGREDDQAGAASSQEQRLPSSSGAPAAVVANSAAGSSRCPPHPDPAQTVCRSTGCGARAAQRCVQAGADHKLPAVVGPKLHQLRLHGKRFGPPVVRLMPLPEARAGSAPGYRPPARRAGSAGARCMPHRRPHRCMPTPAWTALLYRQGSHPDRIRR